MSTDETEALRRENTFLKSRVARLQEDVTDLSSEVDRLRQRLEHIGDRQNASRPNPLGGGQ